MIWTKLEYKKPITYISGDFDGLKSDQVLVIDKDGKYSVSEMYEWFYCDTEFCYFYDVNGFEVKNVEYWTKIIEPI